MTHGTPIEWTHWPGYRGETLNPVVAYDLETGRRGWHCERVSDGCKNCYAATLNRSQRFQFGTGHDFSLTSRKKVRIELHEKTLLQPLSWKQPRAIFWGDMTDLYGEWVPFEWLDKMYAVMALTPQHVHMVLTKRPERMAEYLSRGGGELSQQAIQGQMGYLAWLKCGPVLASRKDIWIRDNHPAILEGFSWPLPNVLHGTSVEDQKAAD